MGQTTKPRSEYDQTQIIQKVYNPAEGVLATGTFISAQLNNNVQVGYPDDHTETYSFYEVSNLLYVLTVVYTDSTKESLLSVTRTT